MSVTYQITYLESIFHAARHPERAIKAATYMKNNFSFFGMETQVRRSVQKEWLTNLTTSIPANERWDLIRALWEKNEREFQYAAIDWLNTWPNAWMNASDGDQLKWIIRQKSWWDSVDAIASNYLGKWAKLFPLEARDTFEEWRYESSFWLQRSCLIYQLKYSDKTDVAYLESLIEQLLPQKEFFIQKAIGWSLRQLSKHNEAAVRTIISRQPLKGLALREATKYIKV